MIVNPDGSVSVSAMPNVYLGSIPFLHGGWLQQMQQQAAQLAQTQAAQAQAQTQAAQAQAQAQAAQAQVDPYSAIEPYLGFNLNPDDFYSGMPLSPQTAPTTAKPAPELMPSHQPVVPGAPAQPDVDLSVGYGFVPSPVMTQEPGTNYWTSLLGTALGGGLLTNLMATYLRNRNAVTGVGVGGKPFVNIPDTPPRPWFNMATYSDTPGGVSAARMAELRGNPAAIEYANSINKPRYPLLGPHLPPPGYTGVWTEDMIKAAFPEYNQPFNVTDPLAPKTDMQNYLLRRGPAYDDPRAVEQMFKIARDAQLDPANAPPINIEEKLTSAQRRGSPPKSAVDRSVEAGMNASTPLKRSTAANMAKRATAAKPLIITPTKTSAQPTVPTSVEPGLASSARVGGLSSRVARAMGRGMNFTLPASIAVLAAALADPGRVEAAQRSVPQLPVPKSINWFPTLDDMIGQSTIQGINDVPVFLQLLSQMMANMPEDGDLMW